MIEATMFACGRRMKLLHTGITAASKLAEMRRRLCDTQRLNVL